MLCCLKRPSAVTTEADKSKRSPKASRQPSDSSHYSPEFTPATEPRTGGTVSRPHLRLRAPAGRRTSLRRLLPRRFDAKSVGLKIPAEAGRSSLTPPQRSPAAPRSNFLVTCDRAAGRRGGGEVDGRGEGRPGGGRRARRGRRGLRVPGGFEASRIPGSHVLGAQSIGENVPPHRPGRTLCLARPLARQPSRSCRAFDFSLLFCVSLSRPFLFILLASMHLFRPPFLLSYLPLLPISFLLLFFYLSLDLFPPFLLPFLQSFFPLFCVTLSLFFPSPLLYPVSLAKILRVK